MTTEFPFSSMTDSMRALAAPADPSFPGKMQGCSLFGNAKNEASRFQVTQTALSHCHFRITLCPLPSSEMSPLVLLQQDDSVAAIVIMAAVRGQNKSPAPSCLISSMELVCV